MRATPVAACLVVALVASACASTKAMEVQPTRGPFLIRPEGEMPPPQARHYADCIAAAAAAKTYVKEPGQNHLRFTCTGPVAHAFYDALGAWSAAQLSEYAVYGRTERYAQRLVRDTVGIDSCSTEGASDYSCTVVLNVGEFLSAD
ncbi:hypothetical protein [Brevundimonas sp.]|jgi:hypothetical protein|uniref:hypothetical protein n=1 Tax=Brevundimonas sp. TaxID=1871086 RepID=UPI003782E698